MCGTENEGRSEAVREELGRLLESPAFRTSKRCSKFLEHVVEHTLRGPDGALKERSIGVELFQLPQDFDSGQHTIVRVTANEVRKKIAQHYLAANGAYHPVRIGLPAGSYSAEFQWAPTPPVEPEIVLHDVPLAAPSRRLSWLAIACSAATLLLVGGLLFWRSNAVKPAAFDSAANPPPSQLLSTDAGVRMIAGSNHSYVDRSGRTWGPERFVSGGTVMVRPSERVFRTLDPDIYRHLRIGEFKYDIPLDRGSYELHLHFAETGLADFISAESSGEGQRVFRVSANGKRILEAFDVVADAAGSNTADERVFRDIVPAEDGFLHLSFSAMRGSAMVSAIEVLPSGPGKVRPIRIRAGWTSSWQDSSERHWQADSYFLGGNALVRTTNPAARNSIVPDMALYASERWGHFTYAIPVPDGRYRVQLKFLEGHYGHQNIGGGGKGSRVFDVYCNGVALLRDFDIYKEAGGEGRALDRIFNGVRPNAQGKIVLSFVPVAGMACVNGIEVFEESK
ncbi:MAG TPA: malectin domain-containing carbohydrate-binding protein [Bryobacteraceae bacterium]|jgi:hypothetical protein